MAAAITFTFHPPSLPTPAAPHRPHPLYRLPSSGEELLTLKGHSDTIWSVAFSTDGQRIVTGSDNNTAKVWNAATAQQVAAWQEEERAAAQ